MENRRQWLQGRFCQRHGVVPLVDDGTTVTLGTNGELCPKVQGQLEIFYCGYKDIRWRQLEDEEFQMHLARHFSISHTQEQERNQLLELPAVTVGEQMMATAAPVVNMLNSILQEATMRDATDIHICPDCGGWYTGLRIDGKLERHLELEEEMGRLVVSRIKLLSGMNVLEHRRCQDGRFTHLKGEREYEIRASILPAWNGESVVLRILEGWRPIPSLEELGFTSEQRTTLERLVVGKGDRAGLVLVTGPTGSGKTTTLASLLALLNRENVQILTVEDPVEYRQKGMVQIQVDEECGRGFAEVLRRALRHDPDIIMVGELRDRETAQLSVRMALTGHLVLATLHTGSCAEAPLRLVDMGVPSYLVAAVLRGVVAQRLVPKGGGGRTVAAEILVVDRQLADMMAAGASRSMVEAYMEGHRQ